MNQFATNLKAKRLALNWSQERAVMEISIAHGKRIDKTTYQHWEAQRSVPRIDMLKAITEVFLVDDLYLFLFKG